MAYIPMSGDPRLHRTIYIPSPPPPPPVFDPDHYEEEETEDGPNGPYRIGYGKPPLHTRFQPGRSGNPKGRPHKTCDVDTVLTKNLLTKVKVQTTKGPDKVVALEAVMIALIREAMRGNMTAIKLLFERIDTFLADAADGRAAAMRSKFGNALNIGL